MPEQGNQKSGSKVWLVLALIVVVALGAYFIMMDSEEESTDMQDDSMDASAEVEAGMDDMSSTTDAI